MMVFDGGDCVDRPHSFSRAVSLFPIQTQQLLSFSLHPQKSHPSSVFRVCHPPSSLLQHRSSSSMEEREPPTSHLREEEDHGTLNSATHPQPKTHDAFSSGTYVVHFPKDQIYRVPPPENAAYLQSIGSKQTQRKRSSCCSCLIYTLLVLVLLVLILLIILGIFYLVLKPKGIHFSVNHVLVVNQPNLKYQITMDAENPNERLDAFYMTGGHASLSFKQHNIATGELPADRSASNISTPIRLVLLGSDEKLPPEVQKSLKRKGSKKKSIDLSLSVHIPVGLKIGAMTMWSMKMAVSCNLKVDTLAKGTRVLSRECHSKVI